MRGGKARWDMVLMRAKWYWLAPIVLLTGLTACATLHDTDVPQ